MNAPLPLSEAQRHCLGEVCNYHLERHPFNCDLLLLLPDTMVARLTDALESLLAD